MITIKSKREIELMRVAGNIVYKTHKYLKKFLKPGITTKKIDDLAEMEQSYNAEKKDIL